MTPSTTMKILSASENANYGRQAIPSARDHEITVLLESFAIADLATQITEEHFAVLRAYAERMASHAVRLKNPTVLQLGLTALGLAGIAVGTRDSLTVLPLFYHAAKMIGMMPHGLFQSVGATLGGQVESVLEEFLGRPEEEKSLGTMGYRVGRDESGFRYEREW